MAKKKKYPDPIPVRLDTGMLQRLGQISHEIQEPMSTVIRLAVRLGLRGLEAALREHGSLEAALSAIRAERDDSRGITRYPDHQPETSLIEDRSKKKSA